MKTLTKKINNKNKKKKKKKKKHFNNVRKLLKNRQDVWTNQKVWKMDTVMFIRINNDLYVSLLYYLCITWIIKINFYLYILKNLQYIIKNEKILIFSQIFIRKLGFYIIIKKYF